MQIRCINCHKPYALSKEMVLNALEVMETEQLSHFDTPCPHCRRVNHISRAELVRAVPDRAKQVKEE
jgi:phage FluMu protein Com